MDIDINLFNMAAIMTMKEQEAHCEKVVYSNPVFMENLKRSIPSAKPGTYISELFNIPIYYKSYVPQDQIHLHYKKGTQFFIKILKFV